MKNFFLISLAVVIVISACSRTKPVKTVENLKSGIKGETTASAKYAAFAIKAKEEGNEAIAKLFEAASRSESIHAKNHGKVLEGMNVKMENFTPEYEVKTTAENLQAAIDGETYEVKTMYPQFIADAKTEKGQKAEKSFTWANDTEKKHRDFYSNALNELQASNEKSLPAGYAVCPVCGNTYVKGSEDSKCAFCQKSASEFIII